MRNIFPSLFLYSDDYDCNSIPFDKVKKKKKKILIECLYYVCIFFFNKYYGYIYF